MNQESIERAASLVGDELTAITKTGEFRAWFEKERSSSEKDLVVFNNSYVFRDSLKTTTAKSPKYLCVNCKALGRSPLPVRVIEPPGFNSDYKHLREEQANRYATTDIVQALQAESRELGRLVFLFIGELDESITMSVPIKHKRVVELEFNPAATKGVDIVAVGSESKRVLVHDLSDPESVWTALCSALASEPAAEVDSLEKPLADAFEKLQHQAHAAIRLPMAGTAVPTNTLLSRFRGAVAGQRQLYENALAECDQGKKQDGAPFREVLRISYNFADDLLKLLPLLVSVCDLKPCVLWLTIEGHHALAGAFRRLPWTKSKKKPSLERYRDIIAGARNRVFHTLLAFDRSVVVNLEGVDIGAKRLTLLHPHQQRKSALTLDYRDRGMVDALSELTRSQETSVPSGFWVRNLDVIRTFEDLLKRTENALGTLLGIAP